jgi:hypothetical protein
MGEKCERIFKLIFSMDLFIKKPYITYYGTLAKSQ